MGAKYSIVEKEVGDVCVQCNKDYEENPQYNIMDIKLCIVCIQEILEMSKRDCA